MPRFSELSLSDDPSQFVPLISEASFVIATDRGNDEVFYTARFSTWRGSAAAIASTKCCARLHRIPSPEPILASGFRRHARRVSLDASRVCRRFSSAARAVCGTSSAWVRAAAQFRQARAHDARRRHSPRGQSSVTFIEPNFHDFTYRYAIKQQLVSTVMVRFSLNKALPPDAGSHDDLGILFRSAELNPIPRL
jgi:hypothetical protein